MDSRIVEVDGIAPDLVCPGSTGCEVSSGPFFVGAAKKSITPTIEAWTDLDGNGIQNGEEPFEDLNGNDQWDGIWLAGFGMGRAATDVHDNVWARAISMRRGDLRIGMVALDLIGFWYHDSIAIRVAAKDAGLEFDHIVIASTHQHEGPDTMGLWGKDPSMSGYDPNYIDFIREQAVEALREAATSERQASVDYTHVEARHLIHDSRLPEVVDPTIHALRFVADNDDVISTAVIWGNHPEALGSENTLLTSDYPHYIRATLEEAYENSVSVFFSGLLGGLMTTIGIVGCPDLDGIETCPQGTFERAEYVGVSVAQQIIESFESGTVVSESTPDLSCIRNSFLAPLSNDVFVYGFKIGLLERDGYLLEDGTRVESAKLSEVDLASILSDFGLGTEVSSVVIGPLEIASVPGELYPELFLTTPDGGSYVESPENADFFGAQAEPPIQQLMRSDKAQAIINNSSDALGYIIPKAQFDYSPPYAYAPDGQYGEQNSTGEELAGTIAEAFEHMSNLRASSPLP